MYYKLSRDYQKLFDLISAGEIIAAFVDYEWGKTEMHRDICKIQKHYSYQIYIGVRGISYGGVYSFQKDKANEKDLFIGQCKALNLEWIEN